VTKKGERGSSTEEELDGEGVRRMTGWGGKKREEERGGGG